MAVDQEFPVSIEVQLLGGRGSGKRSTANLCTPGTHVVMNGELVTRHCTDSQSDTYHGDQWVTAEVEVRGAAIQHIVDGKPVLSYSEPQLDERSPEAKKLLDAGHAKLLTGANLLYAVGRLRIKRCGDHSRRHATCNFFGMGWPRQRHD